MLTTRLPKTDTFEFFDNSNHDLIHTASHLRKWLLTSRKDYHVVSHNVIPKLSLLGYYHDKDVWLLEPDPEKEVQRNK